MGPPLRRRALLGTLGTLAVAGCRSTPSEATFVAPRAALIDDELALELHDLPGNREVTVTARTTSSWNDDSTTWSASASFVSSSEGIVSLHGDPPVEGDYSGVDPMGLFWTMTPENSDDAFFPPTRHEVTLTARVDGGTVAETAIDRRLTVAGMTEQSLEEDLVGTVHTPPGGGPAPGVVLLHGSEGRELTSTAQLLSSHGFVTLSLQYFGEPDGLPDILSAVPVEYVQRAIDRLLAHPRVTGPGVGVWGVSKGAELGLVVASYDERVDAVVAIAPSSLVWEGFDAEGYPTGTSSWTRGGEPVPYLPYPDYDAVPESADPFEQPRSFYEYSQLQATPEQVAAATIAVERVDGDVLLFSGTDDQLWHSTPMGEQVINRLTARNHPHRADHRAVEGAGHLFQLPFLPTYGTSEFGGYPLGGTREANARASREYWPGALDLLADLDGDFEADPPPVDADVEPGADGSDANDGLTARSAGIVAAVLLTGAVVLGAALYALPRSAERMESEGERAIESEVTRVDAVRYLQGALGHAVGSTLFLGTAGLIWLLGYGRLAYVSVAVAFLVSTNGLSIWAWDGLQSYFAARTPKREGTDNRRTLTANPLAADSRVELKAGAVMTLVFVGLLVLGRLALQLLGPRLFGYLCVGCLALGNVAAVANAVYS
jgi:nucleolar protein 56